MLVTTSDCTPTLLCLQSGVGEFSLSKGLIFEVEEAAGEVLCDVLTCLKSLQVVSNTSPVPSAPHQTVRTPFSVYRFPDCDIHSGRFTASRIPSLSDACSPVTLRQVLGFPQLRLLR